MYCHCRPLENQRIILEILIEAADGLLEVLKGNLFIPDKVPAPFIFFSNIREKTTAVLLKASFI